MSRRRPTPNPHRPSGPELALEELCVKFGYCLPPAEQQAILDNLPADADAFIDAVVTAEGLDPNLMTKQERGPMVEIVTRRLVYNDYADGFAAD
jgi:hypothetical protein